MKSFRMISIMLGVWLLSPAFNIEAKAPDAAQQKINTFVLKNLQKKNKKMSVLVIMNQQADLSGRTKFTNKIQRGRYVYDALSSTARSSQKPLISWLMKKNLKYKRYYIVNMLAVFNVNLKTVLKIARRADVARISANPRVRGLPEIRKEIPVSNNHPKGVEENISSIGANRVWDEFNIRGEGIVVAGQDTGIEWDHPALKNSYRGWNGAIADHNFNWHDAIHDQISPTDNPCGYSSPVPCDDHAHGTHTLGTVIGDDGLGNQIGVTPGSKWIGCRNMDMGYGRPSTYIECFEWFLAPYPFAGDPLVDGEPDKAPHVINNSWGCPPSEGCDGADILPVLESIKAAGIMVVASAGNEGPDCSTIADPPAMHSGLTLSVGAHAHASGNIATFSSRGPSKFDGVIGPDITAPGVSIRSSVVGGEYSGIFWSGTSMAGPHAVGVVALLWSADPSLIGNIDKTTAIILNTATSKQSNQECGGVSGNNLPNNTFGYGLINAYDAVGSRVLK